MSNVTKTSRPGKALAPFIVTTTNNNKLLENQIKIKKVYNLCRIWLCVIDFAPLGLTMIV
jgi:hypothetical protein